MFAFVHGYGLAGSGSNLWTAAVVRALCENGESLHLVSQESSPERFDFVTEAHRYAADGTRETLFQRASELPGRCVLHRPDLDVLPTYVRPQNPSDYVVCILDLDDDAIEEYLDRHVRLLERLVDEEGVGIFHVNHVLLLSDAARRVKETKGTPYAVTPHGSALEYIAKREERGRSLAAGALAAAERIFALNGEVRGRLLETFPDVEGLAEKVAPSRVGVDTRRFRPVAPDERRRAMERLKEVVAEEPRGRGPEKTEVLRREIEEEIVRLRGNAGPPGSASPGGHGGAPSMERLEAAVREAADYARQHPDADLEAKVDAVAWEEEPVVLYVGRLTAAKGFPALAAAWPSVVAARPDARLLVVGNGPGREVMEAFRLAAARGRFDLAAGLASWGGEEDAARYPAVAAWLEELRAGGGEDAYAEAAERVVEEDRFLHLGFLGHEALRHVYGCADVAVFPSMLPEVGPMVALEAAAAGCVPVGTYHAGMKDILDTLAPALPESLVDEQRLRPEPEHVVADIVGALINLLSRDLRAHAEPLRERTVATYDWREVARLVGGELKRIAEGRAG